MIDGTSHDILEEFPVFILGCSWSNIEVAFLPVDSVLCPECILGWRDMHTNVGMNGLVSVLRSYVVESNHRFVWYSRSSHPTLHLCRLNDAPPLNPVVKFHFFQSVWNAQSSISGLACVDVIHFERNRATLIDTCLFTVKFQGVFQLFFRPLNRRNLFVFSANVSVGRSQNPLRHLLHPYGLYLLFYPKT